jgi:hypothetical protein
MTLKERSEVSHYGALTNQRLEPSCFCWWREARTRGSHAARRRQMLLRRYRHSPTSRAGHHAPGALTCVRCRTRQRFCSAVRGSGELPGWKVRESDAMLEEGKMTTEETHGETAALFPKLGPCRPCISCLANLSRLRACAAVCIVPRCRLSQPVRQRFLYGRKRPRTKTSGDSSRKSLMGPAASKRRGPESKRTGTGIWTVGFISHCALGRLHWSTVAQPSRLRRLFSDTLFSSRC